MSVVLSEHLPLLASSPNGIQKLRGLILELAVRGKLVPQDPKGEPALGLLKRIAKERTRLEDEGKIKKTKPLPVLDKADCPYDIPDNWAFARLGDLLLGINSGGTPSKNNPAFWDGDIPWASVKDLRFGEPLIETQDRITSEGLNAGSFLAVSGSVLVCTRMGLGKIGEAKIDVAINQDLKALRLSDKFNKQYFIKFFKTIAIKGSGMTVAGIKQDELLAYIVAVPPLAEQHRIVAKVDELMALCDRLEAEVGAGQTAHTKLVETLLGTLTQSTDAAALAANWQRLAEHFTTLFTTESSLEALKQTILQLAVMGRLVPQDPKDEPASELLKRIARERARLEAEGACKKSKPMPPLGEDEQPFEVSKQWQWVRLSTLVSMLGDGLHGTPNYTSGTPYYFINGNNLVGGAIVIKPGTKTVSESEFNKHRKPLSDSSVLVSINGTLGRVAFYRGEQVVLGKSACFFNLLPHVDRNYVRLILESLYFLDFAFKSATGTTIRNLGLKAMNDFPVPLPPLAEQCRIVAKVDEMMALCDRLKSDLAESRTRQDRLATTLIDTALKAA